MFWTGVSGLLIGLSIIQLDMELTVAFSLGRIAALLVVVWLIGSALLMTQGPYADLDPYRAHASIPEETPGMTSVNLTNFLSSLGPAGQALYARAQWFDFLTPLLFGTAGIFVLAWACGRLQLSPNARGILVALPILAALAEVIENTLLLSAVSHYPEPGILSNFVGIVTSAKLGLFAVTVVAALTSSIWAAVRTRRVAA